MRASSCMRLRLRSLDQFELVAFRRIDERNCAALAIWMRTVGKRIAFLRGLAPELLDVVHFESEVSQIGAHHDRTAFIKLADLDFFLAFRRFQENQLRAAAGSLAADFLEPENVAVKGNRLLQVGDAITRVQELLDDGVSYCPRSGEFQTVMRMARLFRANCHPESRRRRGTSQLQCRFAYANGTSPIRENIAMAQADHPSSVRSLAVCAARDEWSSPAECDSLAG